MMRLFTHSVWDGLFIESSDTSLDSYIAARRCGLQGEQNTEAKLKFSVFGFLDSDADDFQTIIVFFFLVHQPTAGAVLPAVHDRTEGVPDRWRTYLERSSI